MLCLCCAYPILLIQNEAKQKGAEQEAFQAHQLFY